MLGASQWSEKWGRKLKSSGPDVEAGVRAVTKPPSASAIAKKEKFRANLLASIDDGTWERQLGKVTVGDYQQAMINKGIPNMQRGVDSALPKVTAFASVAIPHIQQGQAMIEAMPDLTLEDSKSRVNKWIDHMATLNYKRR